MRSLSALRQERGAAADTVTPRGRKPEVGSAVVPFVETGDESAVVLYEPPDDLTPEAARLWRVLIPDLVGQKVYRESDGVLLSELVSALSMAREFRGEIDLLRPELTAAYERRDFETADVLSGTLKRARTGYREMMQTAMSIAGEFGISPVSRLRLGLTQLQGASLLASLGGSTGGGAPAVGAGPEGEPGDFA